VEDLADAACPACQGTRLNATAARRALCRAWASPTLPRLSVGDVRAWVQTLQAHGGMTQREADIARDLVPEIKSRLEFLEAVGLGYLTLDRGAPTLERRRGAAHPAGGAIGQQPARRVLRARRAHHRPAPARQQQSCWALCKP